MLDRTTPWAVAFAFVLLVATAGAATQKAPLFATVGGGLDLAGTEASADADVSTSVEVRTPETKAALAKVGASVSATASARGHAGDGSKSPPPGSQGPSSSGNGTSGNGTSSPPAPGPAPTPGNGTAPGNGNSSSAPRQPLIPQRPPSLTPERQNVTGNTRTTMRYEFSVTNPDAKAQHVKLLIEDSPGWVSNISEEEIELEPGETRVIEGRTITLLSTGGRATITIHAYGSDGHDDAVVHVCARGIFVDLCEPVTIIGGGSRGNGTTPTNNSNTTTPPANETPPANQTPTPTPPTNETTTPPANESSTPPANGTNSTSSSPPPPATNQTGSASPAPTPPPQSPPPPPPSNNTSTANASPPAQNEEDDGDGAWVHADVGAEGEASSDGLRVEV